MATGLRIYPQSMAQYLALSQLAAKPSPQRSLGSMRVYSNNMESSAMSARHKLNSASIQGAFIVAGIAGWAFGSWSVFLIAIAILLVCSMHSGDIRPNAGNRR